ncbi:MAG: OsmC family protein [Streptomyces sp.]
MPSAARTRCWQGRSRPSRPPPIRTSHPAGGGGAFTESVLRSRVTVAEDSMVAKAITLHGGVPQLCFIARSVNFPVRHEPTVRVTPE